MEHWIWIALMLAVAALGYAGYKIAVVSKANAGNDRMQEIAQAISEGARAFLFAEYRILVVFVIVLFVAIGFGKSQLIDNVNRADIRLALRQHQDGLQIIFSRFVYFQKGYLLDRIIETILA